MPADRDGYATRQAALLDALLRDGMAPDGFSVEDVEAAADALRRKRGRAIAKTWPALTHALGAQFDERFTEFSRATPVPATHDATADGLRFARSLPRSLLTDNARVELLIAQSTTSRHGVPRRTAYIRVSILRNPTRLVALIRDPRRGIRLIVIPDHER